MYDHYIGLDWAQANMAIARFTKKNSKPHVIDTKADIAGLKTYLKSLKGRIALTFEETTTSQWLYTELRDLVDKLVVCDPHHNKLMFHGPKNDKIDAIALAKLLRLGEVKPVFHSGDHLLYLRKVVSGYEDTVKAYVRCVNQRSALFRAIGKNHKKEIIDIGPETFIIESLDRQIEQIKEERLHYETEFARLCQKHKTLRNLKTIPGISDISAVKIASRIVDINRFPTVKHLWSYAGLVKYEKLSGGRSYGKRKARFCRSLKGTICTSVVSATREACRNPIRERYDFLRLEKRYSDSKSKVAIRRFFVSIVYGVLKSNKKFDPKRFTYEKK